MVVVLGGGDFQVVMVVVVAHKLFDRMPKRVCNATNECSYMEHVALLFLAKVTTSYLKLETSIY